MSKAKSPESVRQELAALAARPESTIDFSVIPATLANDWKSAQRSQHMQAEEKHIADWHAAIKVGDDQLKQGEGVVYSAGTLVDITQNAIEAMHSGRSMDPDVLP